MWHGIYPGHYGFRCGQRPQVSMTVERKRGVKAFEKKIEITFKLWPMRLLKSEATGATSG